MEEPRRIVETAGVKTNSPVAKPAMAEENDVLLVETGWEKEREAFLVHLARSQRMEVSAMAGIRADWHDSFADAPHEYSAEHTRGEPFEKYRKLSVLNQTSRMLSSASRALSGGGDEAGVILGALAGAAVGVALGIAEHHKQTEASQVESTLGNPPQSTPTQPSTESQQDAAAPQIKQPMEQSM